MFAVRVVFPLFFDNIRTSGGRYFFRRAKKQNDRKHKRKRARVRQRTTLLEYFSFSLGRYQEDNHGRYSRSENRRATATRRDRKRTALARRGTMELPYELHQRHRGRGREFFFFYFFSIMKKRRNIYRPCSIDTISKF